MSLDAAYSDASKQDLSISLKKANVYGVLLMMPLGVVLAVPYIALWGVDAFGSAWSAALDHGFLALAVLINGIVVHELIHGLSWMFFGKKPRSAITYGFQLKTLTPYAHCKEPMGARAYRLGAAMPGVILGVVPWLIGTLIEDSLLLIFGFIFTIAALGDAMILWLLRSVEPHARVIDHPTRAGCYVLEPDADTST